MHYAESLLWVVENLEHKVFEECVALLQVGMNNSTVNQLAPQAELGPRAFYKCTALRHISLELSEHGPTKLLRSLPE